MTPTTIAGHRVPSPSTETFDDDEQRNPGDDHAVDVAGDGFHERLVVAAAVEEAAPADETGPDQNEARERAERQERPYGAQDSDADR